MMNSINTKDQASSQQNIDMVNSTKTQKKVDEGNNRIKAFIAYPVVVILSILILVWMMQLWDADLSTPIAYSGDALSSSADAKGAFENKWVLFNKNIGAPTGLHKHDFPTSDNLHYLLLKIISFFSKDFATAMNLFYFLTFPLTAVFSMMAMRQFKISFATAIVFSLLYASLPYHFLRIGHLMLTAYYMVPLIVAVTLWVYSTDDLFFTNKKNSEGSRRLDLLRPKPIASIVVALLIASSGIYYAIFAAFFLLVIGLFSLINRKNISKTITAGLLILVIGIGIFINLLPSIAYKAGQGPNETAAGRRWEEVEYHGLKIAQLLLPIDHHRILFFAENKNKYNGKAPLNSENSSATLGVIGSIGFIILLIWLLYRPKEKYSNDRTKTITALSILNISAVLLATIGGFSSLISLFFSPLLRGYNRISVYIAFFSFFAAALLLEETRRYFQKTTIRKLFFYCIIGMVLVVGIMDLQSPSLIPAYAQTKQLYKTDSKFIKRIEAKMPKNAMIYQLPYMQYPEHGAQINIQDYEPFKAYLHSTGLRWSYGTMKGRSTDIWQQKLAKKSSKDFLETIALAGFKGVYIDRFGYADNGAAIEAKFRKRLKTKPLERKDKRLVFFSIENFSGDLKKRYGPKRWSVKQSRVIAPLIR